MNGKVRATVRSNTITCSGDGLSGSSFLKAYLASKNRAGFDAAVKIVAKDAANNDVTVTTSRPSNFPGGATKAVGDLKFKYAALACNDGVHNHGEIGPDCGKAACGKPCAVGKAAVAEGGVCDIHTDCDGTVAVCEGGKCATQAFSCTEIAQSFKKLNKTPKSGIFELVLDTNPVDRKKNVIDKTNPKFKAYCEFEYDTKGLPVGGWTLVEMIRNNQNANSPYNHMNQDNSFPSDRFSLVAQAWKPDNFGRSSNFAGRASRVQWRSVFKHSLGYIQKRYYSHHHGYQLTDVFGTPENGKHILDNKCSDKANFDIAWAYRSRPGTSDGYCFNNGVNNARSNCLCNDVSGGGAKNLNSCPGQHGNWRRYNSNRQDNLWCRQLHQKCYSRSNHHVFGDTYGCNKGGQRMYPPRLLF